MSSNFLLKILKVPDFLAMKPVGINITDSAVFYISLKGDDVNKTLNKYGMKKLPEGTVVKGEIKKPEHLVAVLNEIREENDFQFVHASLPEEESYLFKMTLPPGLKTCEEIRQNIEFRLEENVPLSPSQIIFDFEILTRIDDHVGEVMVSAVPVKTVEDYQDVFTKAGLMVIGFQTEAQAMVKAVVPKGDLRPYIIIDIKDESTTISIIENGIVQFSSAAAIGGHSIDEAISRQLKISLEEAVKIKDRYLYGENKNGIEIFSYLLNFISAVKDETERFYYFWQDKQMEETGSRPEISKIILCGRNSLIIGFERYLYLALKKDVDTANVWVNVFPLDNFLPPMNFVDSLDYGTAVGLNITE